MRQLREVIRLLFQVKVYGVDRESVACGAGHGIVIIVPPCVKDGERENEHRIQTPHARARQTSSSTAESQTRPKGTAWIMVLIRIFIFSSSRRVERGNLWSLRGRGNQLKTLNPPVVPQSWPAALSLTSTLVHMNRTSSSFPAIFTSFESRRIHHFAKGRFVFTTASVPSAFLSTETCAGGSHPTPSPTVTSAAYRSSPSLPSVVNDAAKASSRFEPDLGRGAVRGALVDEGVGV